MDKYLQNKQFYQSKFYNIDKKRACRLWANSINSALNN
ncbi:hypothetical protein BN938_3014 [Mucinivorans hirudinis]|uniref:Uncharacterized protein n=1 Tax=Mucinivorans hirudinis TaxID=1433126 RepID=A0A060RBP6_9BACT|nr:hypothetical protein BN938_3014 [Mucinivorans hirudinis]